MQSDALLSDFSSKTMVNTSFVIDKYGKMPWEEVVIIIGLYLPDSLVTISQEILTGKASSKNSALDEDDYFTIIRDVKYPLLVELSPQDLQYG